MTKTISPHYFDKEAGQRAVDFFECVLCYPDGGKAGQPFMLDEWQKDYLKTSLGWYDAETKELKHQTNWLEVAKGNGKTPTMAGIAVLKAGFCGIINGEIYLLAGTRQQARIALNDAKNIIRLSPGLLQHFRIFRDHIEHIKSGTIIKALSAEAGGYHGLRPDVIIFDEIHVQPHSELYDVMTQALSKKKSSQCFIITTAGFVNTFGHSKHIYAKKIAQGIIKNPAWNVKIYAAPQDLKDAAVYDIKNWYLANPGLGTIKDLKRMKKLAKEAEQNDEMLNTFKRLQLNMWVSSTTEWIALEKFKKCNKGPIDMERHRVEKTPCYCGLDLASTEDLSAFSMMFIEDEVVTRKIKVDGVEKTVTRKEIINIDWVVYFWCPVDRVERKAKSEHVNYSAWAKKGLIFATHGDVQDKTAIFDFVEDMNAKYNIKGVNVDTAFHRSTLAEKAEESAVNWLAHAQTAPAMSQPTKDLRILIGEEKVNYAGNPVLEWQVTEAESYSDSNENEKIMKGTGRGKGAGSIKKKVDGIVAGVMSLSGYMSQPAEKYDTTWI